jgi:succinyl-diaminopimelate desuccinylase
MKGEWNESVAAFNDGLSRQIDERREQLVELCGRLVAASSENPPGDTRDVASVVASFLGSAGVPFEVVAKDEASPNVVARLEGRGAGPHLILNAHMDTIGLGDEDEWTVPPYELTCRDGRLYGLGIGNMKGALAAMCVAFAHLAEWPGVRAGSITLTAVSDEVVFGDRGAEHLLRRDPDLLGAGLLSGEGPGGMRLAVGEKGVAWIELDARVPSQQGMLVEEGSSAVARLAEAVTAIDRLNGRLVALPNDLGAVEVAPADLALRVTANVGVFRAGSVANQVARRARAEVDIRLPPGVALEQIESEISAITAKYPGMSWRRTKGWEANWTTPDRPLPWAVSEAARIVRGSPPGIAVRVPASDASRWRRAGVQAVCYGPQPMLASGVDDYAEEQDVVDCAKVYALGAVLFQDAAEPSGGWRADAK